MSTLTKVWLVIAAVALLSLLVVSLRSRRGALVYETLLPTRLLRRRPPREHFRAPVDEPVAAPPKKRAAIIVNASKFDSLDSVKETVANGCAMAGWGEPIWLETTAEDPGPGQAREAVRLEVDLVCPFGGDGTIRSVATVLTGTDTPMGLLPGGTGNLLARNLDLPIDSLADALHIALTGQNKRLDVGWLTVDRSGEHERPEEHLFLVMAGLGFDAAVMATAPAKLKAAVGPAAYVVSGLQNLPGSRFKARVSLDSSVEFTRRARTVLIGNCGKIFGGLALAPDAKVDDGLLDTVIISPKGVVGWAAVGVHVATRQRRGHERIDRHQSAQVSIRSDRPEEVQIDGDVIGPARSLSARVEPKALLVRVPA